MAINFVTCDPEIVGLCVCACQERDDRFRRALEKVAEAEKGERSLREELDSLRPQLAAVERELEERDTQMEECQKRCSIHNYCHVCFVVVIVVIYCCCCCVCRYKEANVEYKKAKASIEVGTRTVDDLQRIVRKKMDQVTF